MGLEQTKEQTSWGSQHTGHNQMICVAVVSNAAQIIWLWPVCYDLDDVCSIACSKPISVIYVHCSCIESVCMGGVKPRQRHPAAMDIDYTDGLGAGKGANIMRITAHWSQSNDLCRSCQQCSTNHLTVTSMLWSWWCLLHCLLQAHQCNLRPLQLCRVCVHGWWEATTDTPSCNGHRLHWWAWSR